MNELIAQLDNTSSEIVAKTLSTIRKKYFRSQNVDGVKKFRENGGLKPLLNIIRKPNEKSVDVALSILGNCCLEMESRKLVKNPKTIASLITILNNLEIDSIQNRTCRTIANLADDIETTASFHDEGAIRYIVRFLNTTKSSASQQSAIRALRILACSTEHRENIVKHDGIQAVASLLNSEKNAVLIAVVRALAHLTRRCTPECARQVDVNNGICRLVSHVGGKDEIIRLNSMKILTNLVQQSEIRPVIGNAGAVPLFVDQVENSLKNKSDYLEIQVKALCLCCREAVNRVRVRAKGGLEILVSLLDSKYTRVHDEVVAAMLNFMYDEKSLDRLLELDLVSILVDKMSVYIEETADEEKSHEPQDPNKIYLAIPTTIQSHDFPSESSVVKRKHLESEESREDSKKGRTYRINSPSYQQVQNEILELGIECQESSGLLDDNGQWSPTNTIYSPVQSPPDWSRQGQFFAWPNSPGQLSPESEDRSPRARRASEDAFSRSSSPASSSPVGSPNPQYACYSPVCDDEEECEEPATSETVKTKELDAESSISNASAPSVERTEEDDVEIVDPKLPLCLRDSGPVYVQHILLILSRVSQMEKPHVALLSQTALDALLVMSSRKQNPLTRAARILLRLVRNPLCFESLMIRRFPQQVLLKLDDANLQHLSDECRTCGSLRHLRASILRTLEMQSESPYGLGTIVRLLSYGNMSDRYCVAMMLPYTVRSKCYRHKVFMQYNALELLFDVLIDPENVNFKMAILSLIKIWSQMDSNSLLIDILPWDNLPCIENHCNYNGLKKDVCFLLDDGEKVYANRQILVTKSEVFAAMFSGNFKESAQSRVKFGDVSKGCFEYIMHFLHGCLSSGMVFCATLRCRSWEVMTESVIMADKLLLGDLKSFVHDEIVRIVNGSNAVSLYTFAKTNDFSAIAKSVLNCVMGVRFNNEDKKNFLIRVLNSNLNEVFLDDMRWRLKEHLHFNPISFFM